MKLVVYSVQTGIPSPKVWRLTFVLCERGGLVAKGASVWRGVLRNPSQPALSPFSSQALFHSQVLCPQTLSVAPSQRQTTKETGGGYEVYYSHSTPGTLRTEIVKNTDQGMLKTIWYIWLIVLKAPKISGCTNQTCYVMMFSVTSLWKVINRYYIFKKNGFKCFYTSVAKFKGNVTTST